MAYCLLDYFEQILIKIQSEYNFLQEKHMKT